MRWKQFLTPVESMTAEEAKTYITTHKEGMYLLLDVRQPKEYERGHLPGSRLIPLATLADQLEDLDPAIPTIVYCAIGGRSRVAVQLLSGQGFTKIYNLKGGITAWQSQTAVGPEDEGMALFRGDESPQEALILAYGLEEGLEGFYQRMVAVTEQKQQKEIFRSLASFEDIHKQRIFDLYASYHPEVKTRKMFEANIVASVMHEGYTIEEFLEKHASPMQTTQELLELAMIIETQACDLYSRYARKSENPEAQSMLLQMAEEEKSHLQKVSKLREVFL